LTTHIRPAGHLFLITFDIAPGQDSLPGNASSPLSLVSELYIFNESRLSLVKIKYLLFTYGQLTAQKTICRVPGHTGTGPAASGI
jgi:hypothetical protein